MRSLQRLAIIGLLGLLPLLSGIGLAQAAGGNAYYVNGATGGSPTCSSAANNPALPFATIGDALSCVNTDGTTASTPDSVSIAGGTYDEHDLDVNGYASIEGKPGATIIDAGQQGRVLTVEPGVTAHLSGLTIQNGLACNGLSSRCVGFGGGIDNLGSLTVSNSTLSNNTACLGNGCAAAGGGIYNQGTLSLSNSTLSGNTACTGDACFAHGGGIGNASLATLSLSNSTLSGNTTCSGSFCTGQGGGIYNPGSVSGSTVALSNSTLSGNIACSGSPCVGKGGGIYNQGTLSLTNSTLGGKASAAGNVACSGSSCSGNGGGLFNNSSFGGPSVNWPVTLTNDTITSNVAYTGTSSFGDGGGIFNASGSPTLKNDTIKNNTPDNCAALSGSVTGCKG